MCFTPGTSVGAPETAASHALLLGALRLTALRPGAGAQLPAAEQATSWGQITHVHCAQITAGIQMHFTGQQLATLNTFSSQKASFPPGLGMHLALSQHSRAFQ